MVIAYPDVDWNQMQAVYGWAALQYQAWARGSLKVDGTQSQTVVLYTDNILEYYIDGQHVFGGDMYAFRAAPVVLHLQPGEHQLDLRLVRDVRAMGGVGEPTISVTVKVELSRPGLNICPNTLLLPDRIGGKPASSFGSVTVRNDAHEDVEITRFVTTGGAYEIQMLDDHEPINLASGQTRPLPFRIDCKLNCPDTLQICLCSRPAGSSASADVENCEFTSGTLKSKRVFDPHKITYLHPGGVVSYGMLQIPSPNAKCPDRFNGGLAPIMLQLHGAGVEADNPLVADSLKDLDLCAWILFPSGGTPWSGDDWHQWGFADVEAAVASLSDWISLHKWRESPPPDYQRWLVTGHSNGGQGAWYTMIHHPDKIIAGAVASGYSSIQNYVPYHLWRPMNPAVLAILEGSLSTYRHELLVSNLQGMPIVQQHGGADDNVPVFHARLMKTLLEQVSGNSTYVELPRQGHVFPGMMATEPLATFYQAQLRPEASHTGILDEFILTVARPSDTTSKNGVAIRELLTSGQLGIAKVITAGQNTSKQCHIMTSNVRTLSLLCHDRQCPQLTIDDQPVSDAGLNKSSLALGVDKSGHWHVLNNHPDIRPSGGMDTILQTHGRFMIYSGNTSSERGVALQVSRNLCQYFNADAHLLHHEDKHNADGGNVIRVSMARHIDLCAPSTHCSLQGTSNHSAQIIDHDGNVHSYRSGEGLGAVYINHTAAGRLELVVWGSNEIGLDIAARLVPTLTGVGQPDFVIADRRMLWQGAGGVLAMGFLDKNGRASANSYFTQR